jgi:hypothetical protein
MTDLPKFTFDGFFWVAEVILPSWSGFRDASGPYTRLSGNASDGTVKLVYAPEGRDDAPLNEAEQAQIGWLIENETTVSSAVLTGLLAAYPALRASYDCYDGRELADYMPDVSDSDGLRALIGLSSVNIHALMTDDVPYIGFEFGCRWDEEHGCGVLMRGTRVVEVGGADSALLLWMAQRDFEGG